MLPASSTNAIGARAFNRERYDVPTFAHKRDLGTVSPTEEDRIGLRQEFLTLLLNKVRREYP